MKFKFLFILILLLISGVFIASVISVVIIDFILAAIKGVEFSISAHEIWGVIKMSVVGGSIGAIGIWLSVLLRQR